MAWQKTPTLMTDQGKAPNSTSGSTTAKGKSYETFVQGLYKTLHEAEGFEYISVEHDKEITGRSGCTHQLDVYWEFKIAGQIYRTAIECKAFNKPVSIGRVRDFYGVLADVPSLQGIFVSIFGFQSGAQKYAAHYGINLKEVREPTDEDWKGRIQNIHIRYFIVEPEITDIKLGVTKEYLSTIKPHETVDLPFEGTTAEPFVVDQNGKHVASYEEIRQQLPTNNQIESDLVYTIEFPGCLYNSSTRGRIPIDSVTVRYDVHVDVEQADLFGKAVAKAIMKEVQSEGITFFSRDGGVRPVSS